MEALTDEIIKKGSEVVDAIVAVPESEQTFANTVFPIAQFESEYQTLSTNMSFYRYISADQAKVQQSLALEQKFTVFSIELYMREDFYKALVAFRSKLDKSEGLDATAEERRYLEKTILGMERSGLNKTKEVRDEVIRLQQEMAELGRTAS